MKRVNFQDGVKTQEAKVTIDGTDYEVTPAVWTGTTPLTAFNLNKMQDNIEEEVNITLDTEEPAEEVEITNVAPVNGKIDVSGNSVQSTGIELPEGYTQLEYIESNGTQYIDTGVANSATWELQLKMAWTSLPSGTTQADYVANGINGNMQIGLNPNGYWTTSGSNGTAQPTLNQIYEVSASQSTKNLVVNGTTVASRSAISTSITVNISLFAYTKADNTKVGFCSEKIYNAKIYDNGTLVRNFIPCKRNSDNEIGLYDLVNGVFYTNGGTGTFAYGEIPSPTYPIEIHNVGDNINLFDSEDWYTTLNAIKSTSMMKETVDGIEYYKFRPDGIYNYQYMKGEFKDNTQYKLFCKAREYADTGRNSTGFSIRYTDGTFTSVYIRSITEYNYEIITDVGKTVDYIRLAFANNDFVLVRNIKLTEVITDNSYSPYNCGNANIRVSNKNLFDKNVTPSYTNTTTLSILDTGIKATLTATGTYKFGIIPIPNSSNLLGKTITISGTITPSISNDTNMGRIALYGLGSNGQITGSGLATLAGVGDKSISVTLPNEYPSGVVEYGLLFYSNHSSSNATTNAYVNYTEVQLEEGTATDYVEHQSQLITFPFTSGQRLYKGDYLASDGIHHKRKQITLDSSMGIGTDTSTTNYVRFYFRNVVNDFNSYPECLSNIAPAKTSSQQAGDYLYFFMTNSTNSYIYFNIPKTIATTVADFKTWLSNNPITVEYELATEEIEPYTEEQEEAYWQLQHTSMYEGYTKVECIDETKAKFVVTYSYNNDINVTYGKRIDDLEYKIHQLENAVNNLS